MSEWACEQAGVWVQTLLCIADMGTYRHRSIVYKYTHIYLRVYVYVCAWRCTCIYIYVGGGRERAREGEPRPHLVAVSRRSCRPLLHSERKDIVDWKQGLLQFGHIHSWVHVLFSAFRCTTAECLYQCSPRIVGFLYLLIHIPWRYPCPAADCASIKEWHRFHLLFLYLHLLP